MEAFVVAHYDGETIKQIGPVFTTYDEAALILITAVAAYNGYDKPDDFPDKRKCNLDGEWRQDKHLWKILGNVV